MKPKMAIRINAVLLLLFIALKTGLGLKITKFRVPEHHLVDGEDSDELVLHCEYETDKQDEGHILKWMLNGNMIFQWIPDKSPPQAFGEPFKSSIILPNSTQAPLRFKNPNHNFTGKYTCQVTSFETTVSDNGYVQVVDVSRSALKLNHKINEENIDVECLSTDSYPKPVLNFVVDSDILPAQAYHIKRDNGYFDARLTASFKKDDILEKGSNLGCQLIVGTKKFNVSRTDLYDFNAENGSSSLGSSKTTVVLITLSLLLFNNRIQHMQYGAVRKKLLISFDYRSL